MIIRNWDIEILKTFQIKGLGVVRRFIKVLCCINEISNKACALAVCQIGPIYDWEMWDYGTNARFLLGIKNRQTIINIFSQHSTPMLQDHNMKISIFRRDDFGACTTPFFRQSNQGPCMQNPLLCCTQKSSNAEKGNPFLSCRTYVVAINKWIEAKFGPKC